MCVSPYVLYHKIIFSFFLLPPSICQRILLVQLCSNGICHGQYLQMWSLVSGIWTWLLTIDYWGFPLIHFNRIMSFVFISFSFWSLVSFGSCSKSNLTIRLKGIRVHYQKIFWVWLNKKYRDTDRVPYDFNRRNHVIVLENGIEIGHKIKHLVVTFKLNQTNTIPLYWIVLWFRVFFS